MFNLLRCLSERFDVTAVFICEDDPRLEHLHKVEALCSSMVLLDYPNKKSLLHRIGFRALMELMNLTRALPKERFYCDHPSIRSRIQEVLSGEDFDVVIQTYWYTSQDIPKITEGPLKVLDSHDVLSERFERTAKGDFPIWKRPFASSFIQAYKNLEAQAARCFDLILAVTDHDKNIYDEMTDPDRVLMVPSGIEIVTRGLAPGTARDPNTIAFFGAMKGSVNLEAIDYFYREIFPLVVDQVPEAKLLLVGADPADEVKALTKDNRVTVTGFVENPYEVLSNTAVAVMPLKTASGFRARLVELMQSRVPVVATTISVQGMEVEDGIHLLLADEPEAFAQHVVKFIKDPAVGEKMCSAAFERVVEQYSVEATLGSFVKNLEGRLQARRQTESTEVID